MHGKFTKLAIFLGFFASLYGAASAQTTASAHTYGIRYDGMGREVGTIAPDPDGSGGLKFQAKRTTFGAMGLPSKVETGELSGWQSEAVAPANWSGFSVLSSVEIGYNSNRRKVLERVRGSNNVVVSLKQFSYDGWGRLDCTAERMNPVVFGSPPGSACEMGPVASNGAEDRISKNHYDTAGQLIRVERAVGTSLVQNYSIFSYTDNGKPKTVTDANGNQATYVYDGHDRQIAWRFPSASNGAVSANCNIGTITERGSGSGPEDARGAGDDCEKYSYDRNGNRTRLVKRDGTVIAYAYDALNRMTSKDIDATGLRTDLAPTYKRDVHFGYDLRGLQIYARFDSSATTSEGLTFAYDGFGQLIGSTMTMDGTTRALRYTWDKNGNRTQIKHPDNQQFNYRYDGLNRMNGLLQASVSLGTFTYNNRGLPATLNGGVPTNYGYDNVGRLSTLSHNLGGTATNHDVTFTFGYNPASQIIRRFANNDAYVFTGDVNANRNYIVNGLNQYMSAGTSSFSYDANGNLTVAGNIGYIYDVENRLVSAYGGTTVNLRYDPLGRLYETSGGFLGLTRFLYDGDELVGEYGPSGSMLRRYVHGRGVDDPMIWYEGSGVEASALRRLRTNHQGSVVAVTNNAGAPLAINAYDDWGLPNGWMTASAADDNVGRFQYTGQAWIPELGMYYYKALFYSVTLGRFMQTDPIGYKDQMNLYAYVGNDPVNGTDPDGTQTVPGSQNLRIEDFARLRETIKKDPGLVLDAVMIVGDVLTVPSGEAAAGIALRRGAREVGEAAATRASTLRPGPHAAGSIPARDPSRNFTTVERAATSRNMRETGCHTCGTREPGTRSGDAVPDHQPPSALNPNGESQRLYPHCATCSRRQGGEVTREVMRRRREELLRND